MSCEIPHNDMDNSIKLENKKNDTFFHGLHLIEDTLGAAGKITKNTIGAAG